MRYPLAERFAAPQGEGLYTGTPMKFMRLVGCSVGQSVCETCDTNFAQMYPELGGGLYTPVELAEWAEPYGHVCLTGGEPLDRDLRPLLETLYTYDMQVHIESSGTRFPFWLEKELEPKDIWLCISPKPKYRLEVIELASEIKVIMGGLGKGPGWPTVEDAVRWADEGKLVYLQPQNNVLTIDTQHMDEVLEAVDKYPQLRLSAQLHKYLRTR